MRRVGSRAEHEGRAIMVRMRMRMRLKMDEMRIIKNVEDAQMETRRGYSVILVYG